MPRTVMQEFTVLAEERVRGHSALSLEGPNRRMLYDGQFMLYQSRYVRGPRFTGRGAAEWSDWGTSFAVHEDDVEGIASIAVRANAVLNQMRSDAKAARAREAT